MGNGCMTGCRVTAFKRTRTEAQEVVKGCLNDATVDNKNDRLISMCFDKFVQFGLHAFGELCDGLEA